MRIRGTADQLTGFGVFSANKGLYNNSAHRGEYEDILKSGFDVWHEEKHQDKPSNNVWCD
jgi:hypothetical protein